MNLLIKVGTQQSDRGETTNHLGVGRQVAEKRFSSNSMNFEAQIAAELEGQIWIRSSNDHLHESRSATREVEDAKRGPARI